MDIYTWPDGSYISDEFNRTPVHMYPTKQPWAFMFEGALSGAECNNIIEEQSKITPHKFPHCDAMTTECEYPISSDLYPLLEVIRFANENFFNYDVDWNSTTAWMQTYIKEGSYQKHMDAAPGQCRKLTGVVQLSDVQGYDGGDLRFEVGGVHENAPIQRGSVVVFSSWMPHFVTPITAGKRRTINMGVWGPAWR